MLLLFLVACGGTAENVLRIHNSNEMVEFSKSVNKGTSYLGTTVLLETDIDFTGEAPQAFEPIGNDYGSRFLGTFDGQGHMVYNLVVNTSSQYAGLFGSSEGSTIKNVVAGGSLSVVSTSDSEYAFLGGIIGYCYSNTAPCVIENSVNLASVTFNGGYAESYLCLGGVAGYLYTNGLDASLRNCANYGAVTHSGSSKSSYVGGVVGYSDGFAPSSGENVYVYIQNSVNYGTVTWDGAKLGDVQAGGIVGRSEYSVIENCVSVGKIAANGASAGIGAIVGHSSDSSTSVTHSFWASAVGYSKACGTGTSAVDAASSQISPSADVLGKLNSYASKKSWKKWLLNANGEPVTFVVNYGDGFTTSSPVMLFSEPTNNSERTFSGWYSDEALGTPFASEEVASNTTLYGTFCGPSKYAVTFDVNGGDKIGTGGMTVECGGKYGKLPVPTRKMHSFKGWFTEKTKGREAKTGKRVADLYDHVLYAHWAEATKYVEIIFKTRDLSEKDVSDFIGRHTSAKFRITKFENYEGDKKKVVVEFGDFKTAMKFFEAVGVSSLSTRELVETIGYVSFSARLCPRLFFFLFFFSFSFFLL